MIKKLFVIMLILSVVLSLSACGKNNGGKPADVNEPTSKQSDGNENDPKDQDTTTKGNPNAGGSIYTAPGDELSNFMDAFNDAVKPFEGPINHFETDDFDIFGIEMDYLVPQLQIAFIAMYDALDVFGTDEGEYRNSSGSVITFGKEYVRAEKGFSPNDKEGDKIVEKGSLDTDSNTLKIESYVERDGKTVSRSVTEAVLQSDGTFNVQTLQTPFSKEDIRVEDVGKAYFLVFGNGRLESVHAEFAYDFDFTYTSIEGKKDITAEDMASGYEKIRSLTVENDKAEAFKY